MVHCAGDRFGLVALVEKIMEFMKLRSIRIIGLVLVIVLAFGAGTVVGALSPVARNLTGAPAAFARALPGGPADFAVFWEAWGVVQEHFVDREVLTSKELTYGAIDGLVRALGDEGHTAFLTPEQLEQQQSSMSGKFTGIGAQLGVENGLPVIVSPFDGSPAAEAGVKAGDIILSVDGEDVTSLSLTEIAKKIRGPEGTKVTLTLLREDEDGTLEITIERGEINVPAVDWTMAPGTDVAVLRLTQFSANAKEEVVTALKAIAAADAKGLIVDVRNNPGGLLAQAIGVTSQFLSKGNVLQEENADGERRAFAVEKGGVATAIPMVVLINPGSASSSEIFAGAIQDYKRGQLIGETTFGTGTVLQTFQLDDGSALLLGTSQWLTAEGRLIRKQGIAPDLDVKLEPSADLLTPNTIEGLTPAELVASEDAQFLAGLKALDALPAIEITSTVTTTTK